MIAWVLIVEVLLKADLIIVVGGLVQGLVVEVVFQVTEIVLLVLEGVNFLLCFLLLD